MQNKVFRNACILACIAMTLATSNVRADEQPEKQKPTILSAELGFDVATGKYGTRRTTTTISVPLALTYYPVDSVDVGLSIPYIWQNNGLVVGGRRVKRIISNSAAANHPINGVGDLVLALGYKLVRETDYMPEVHPVVNIKFPTAETGLGSGEYDETFGVEFTKWLRDWYFLADGNYTIQGRSKIFKAKNYFSYDGEVGYEIMEGLRPSLGVKAASPAEQKSSSSVQVEGKITYAFTRSIEAKTYVDGGLTTNVPDWEGGFSLAYSF